MYKKLYKYKILFNFYFIFSGNSDTPTSKPDNMEEMIICDADEVPKEG